MGFRVFRVLGFQRFGAAGFVISGFGVHGDLSWETSAWGFMGVGLGATDYIKIAAGFQNTTYL